MIEALLSPRGQFALVCLPSGEFTVCKAGSDKWNQPSATELNILLQGAEDLRAICGTSLEEIALGLSTAIESDMLLRMILVLIDASSTDSMKSAACYYLNETYETQVHGRYIENRLYSVPLSLDQDIPGGISHLTRFHDQAMCSDEVAGTEIKLAQATNSIITLLKSIQESQARIKTVCSAWDSVSQGYFVEDKDRAIAVRFGLMEAGLFVSLVKATLAGLDLRRIRPVLTPSLAGQGVSIESLSSVWDQWVSEVIDSTEVRFFYDETETVTRTKSTRSDVIIDEPSSTEASRRRLISPLSTTGREVPRQRPWEPLRSEPIRVAAAPALAVRERVWALEEARNLPSTLVRLLSIVQDDEATALDLAEIVGSDRALTLRILGTVNSSYYGFHREIRTVPDAVVILGFDEVERLALAISVINMFGRDPASARTLKMLWRHSLACSVVAGCIESHSRSKMPQIAGAHVAGLLHDIGKAVIAQQFPDAMAGILGLIEDEGYSHLEAEREMLDGYTHCDIGAWLAGRWELPPAIVESIEMHHTPTAIPNTHILTHVAHVSDALCNRFGIRSTNANAPCEFEAASAEAVGLRPEFIAYVEDRLERQRGLMGAMAAGGPY